MNSDKNFSNIDKYLNGELKGEALQQFEKALKKDPDLAKRVHTLQQMSKVFEDTEKIKFRESLQNIDAEFNNNNKHFSLSKNSILMVLLIFFIGLFLWLNQTPLEVLEPEIIENKSTQSSEEPVEFNQEDLEQDSIKNTKDRPIAQNNPTLPTSTNNEVDSSLFIASDIQEMILVDLVRSSFQIENVSPKNGEAFMLEDNRAVLNFSGDIKSAEDIINEAWILTIYNNQDADFDENKPVFSSKFFIRNGTNGFQFSIEVEASFKPGLYYFYIENADKTQLVYVGKFFMN